MKAFLHTYRKALANHADVFKFGEGLKKHGWTVNAGEADAYAGEDLIVQWNIRHDALLKDAAVAGAETCILETAYLEPRREHISVSFGKWINNRNRFYGPFDDPSRWETTFSHLMQPWKRNTHGPIVIMGQMPGDMALKAHVNFFDWVYDTFKAAEELADILWFRPHPGMQLPKPKTLQKHQKHCVHADEDEIWRGWRKTTVSGLQVSKHDLDTLLSFAGRVVTFNSNSGVDAVLAGAPTIAMDKGSMVWDIVGHNLNDIRQPDRTAWAHAMAWKQWTREEIESGTAWGHVCPPHLR